MVLTRCVATGARLAVVVDETVAVGDLELRFEVSGGANGTWHCATHWPRSNCTDPQCCATLSDFGEVLDEGEFDVDWPVEWTSATASDLEG